MHFKRRRVIEYRFGGLKVLYERLGVIKSISNENTKNRKAYEFLSLEVDRRALLLLGSGLNKCIKFSPLFSSLSIFLSPLSLSLSLFSSKDPK